MIIVAGTLHVAPRERDAYLRAVHRVALLARTFPGCLEFSQSPDPHDPGQINVFERWESDDALHAFRESDEPGDAVSDAEAAPPTVLDAKVHKYRVLTTEQP